jgi:hypothetical protein
MMSPAPLMLSAARRLSGRATGALAVTPSRRILPCTDLTASGRNGSPL